MTSMCFSHIVHFLGRFAEEAVISGRSSSINEKSGLETARFVSDTMAQFGIQVAGYFSCARVLESI